MLNVGILGLLLLYSAFTAASPTNSELVVKDYLSTHTIDAIEIKRSQKETLERQLQQLDKMTANDLTAFVRRNEPTLTMMPIIYPLYTTQLTPGLPEVKRVNTLLSHPFFLVGTDSQSKAWLQKHYEELKEVHAIGYVVNIDNENKMRQLQELTPEVHLYVMPIDDIATILHLQHYPVLLLRK